VGAWPDWGWGCTAHYGLEEEDGSSGLDGSVTMAVVVGLLDFDLKAEDRHHPLKDFAGERIVEGLAHKIVLPCLAAIARSAQARQRAVEHSAAPAGG
jgi:hypothetical protein